MRQRADPVADFVQGADQPAAADAPAGMTQARRRVRSTGRIPVGIVFLLPALALFLFFVLYPIVETVRLSVFDWDGLSPSEEFIGSANFVELATDDPYFWTAIRNNVLWGVVSIPIQLVLGLVLAALLDRPLRFRSVYRSAIFVPVVLSSVVVAAVWGWIYNPEVGIANRLLEVAGVEPLAWLGDPDLAFWSALFVGIWRTTGLVMLFYLAALQAIKPELYEAARVDGASAWQQFRRISVPLVKPMTALLLLLGAISTFKEFEIMYILTKGGPAHRTDILSIQIFQQGFVIGRAGYAAAISVVLLVLTILVSILLVGYLNRVNRASQT